MSRDSFSGRDWDGAEEPGGPSGSEDPAPGGGRELPSDERGPIGIFPSWGWVYGTVLAWCACLILFLYWFTVTFDYGAR